MFLLDNHPLNSYPSIYALSRSMASFSRISATSSRARHGFALMLAPLESMPSKRSPSMRFPTSPRSSCRSSPKCPGLSPAEVERFVTFPMELQLTGAPGLTGIRSSLQSWPVDRSRSSSKTTSISIWLGKSCSNVCLEVQELLPPGAYLNAGAEYDRIGRSLSVLSGEAAR